MSYQAVAAVDFIERHPALGVVASILLLAACVAAFVTKTRRIQAAVAVPLAISQLWFIATGNYDLWRTVVIVESVAIFAILVGAILAIIALEAYQDHRRHTRTA